MADIDRQIQVMMNTGMRIEYWELYLATKRMKIEIYKIVIPFFRWLMEKG